MAEDPNIHVVVYGQAYPSRVDLATPVGQVLKTMPERFPDKVFLIASLVTGRVQDGRRYDQDPVEPTMHWDGVPFLQGMENGLRAVRALMRYAEFQRVRGERAAGSRQQAANSEIGEAVSVAEQARTLVAAGDGKPLVERAAKEVLALYGIPVTRERLATSADEAVAAAREIGYPVVLKIESPDIAHKTEAGGVLLNMTDDAEVAYGFAKVIENARQYKADAQIAGVLVQEMVSGGRELILGMTQDPAYGPAIAVGLGGIFVEVLKDVAIGVPPLTERDSRVMLGGLRGASILEGARGAGPADTETVVDILGKFSQLCLDLRESVAEIDINPLLVFGRGEGARVVDCLIVPRTHGAQ
jgi:acetyltransferase